MSFFTALSAPLLFYPSRSLPSVPTPLNGFPQAGELNWPQPQQHSGLVRWLNKIWNWDCMNLTQSQSQSQSPIPIPGGVGTWPWPTGHARDGRREGGRRAMCREGRVGRTDGRSPLPVNGIRQPPIHAATNVVGVGISINGECRCPSVRVRVRPRVRVRRQENRHHDSQKKLGGHRSSVITQSTFERGRD